MYLSRLYSNRSEIFPAINFRNGLNAVLATICLPENKCKDTHNLGKTTLGRLLDFCFLAKKKPDFFLFKHADRFADFVFYLEITTEAGTCLTIRRSVTAPSRIAFKRHSTRGQDFSELPDADWDHTALAFDRARELLDGFLGWKCLGSWSYRKVLGYLLRSQEDFHDVFQLHKFMSKHQDWKPFLALLLGFDDQLFSQLYEKEALLETKQRDLLVLQKARGSDDDNLERIEGLLLVKERDLESRQALLDAFNFAEADLNHTKELADAIDQRIVELNEQRYALTKNKKKIDEVLQRNDTRFRPEAVRRLFEETGVLFPDQLKKDFEQQIRFNESLGAERRQYLQEDINEINQKLQTIQTELPQLNAKRSQILSFLSETDVFNKYKTLTNELTALKADITDLRCRQEYLLKLENLQKDIQQLSVVCNGLRSQLETHVREQSADKNSRYSKIRLFFDEIIKHVIDRNAILTVRLNREGHPEFKAEILDASGNTTGAGLGHTYLKLLCVAFDLAVLRAHLGGTFPRFVFHDGVFETLDPRKKENLLEVLHQYADLGLQPVVTAIDSDLPPRANDKPFFTPEEIILALNDKGDAGRLFKMQPW